MSNKNTTSSRSNLNARGVEEGAGASKLLKKTTSGLCLDARKVVGVAEAKTHPPGHV